MAMYLNHSSAPADLIPQHSKFLPKKEKEETQHSERNPFTYQRLLFLQKPRRGHQHVTSGDVLRTHSPQSSLSVTRDTHRRIMETVT